MSLFRPPKHAPSPDRPLVDSDTDKIISGWNWGAFFFHWIWGIFNKCPIAFLWFIPILGPIIMPFVLGWKGNEWAWNNKEWQDEHHFLRVQKRWAYAALILFLINVAMLVLAGGTKVIPTLLNQEFKFQKLSSKTYRHSEKPVYEEVLILLQKDAEMIGKLGEPLKKGKVFRAHIIPQNSLKADTLVEFEVIGASKKARVYAEARVDTGVVFLKKLILYFDNPYEKIWKLSRLTEQKTA